MTALLPVSLGGRRVRLFCKEEFSLDSLMKRYIILETFFGVAVVVAGLFLGGSVLPALGCCMIALAAQLSAYSEQYHGLVVGFGVFSLLLLGWQTVSVFLGIVSRSGFEGATSPLTVPLVLAVVLLTHSFLTLPLEDRQDVLILRRGIHRMVIFSAVSMLGVVLTYLLSFVLYYTALSALLDGDTLGDFHYLEGVVCLAMVFTSGRSVLRAFFGKEQLKTQEVSHD